MFYHFRSEVHCCLELSHVAIRGHDGGPYGYHSEVEAAVREALSGRDVYDLNIIKNFLAHNP